MAYRVLELGLPGKPKCPDEPAEGEDPSVLLCPRSRVMRFQVAAQAVYIQVGNMPQGAGLSAGNVVWQKAESWMPTTGSIGINFDAVRVWNFTKGKEGQVRIGVS
jgi:hypothetical protein